MYKHSPNRRPYLTLCRNWGLNHELALPRPQAHDNKKPQAHDNKKQAYNGVDKEITVIFQTEKAKTLENPKAPALKKVQEKTLTITELPDLEPKKEIWFEAASKSKVEEIQEEKKGKNGDSP